MMDGSIMDPVHLVMKSATSPRPAFPTPYGRAGWTPTRIFYDCEFLEDGRTIELISIGMVACVYNSDLGRYLPVADFYAINSEAPWLRVAAHPWLADNVLPALPGEWRDTRHISGLVGGFWLPDRSDPLMQPLAKIRPQVEAMITAGGEDVELWAWYAAYDHVALCQLWGPMANLPEGVPKHTFDLKQEAERQGIALPDQPSGEHNALEDARHNVVRARALGVIW